MAEHPNVGLLRKGYDAFSKNDLETLRGLFAPDIVWHVPGNSPISGDYSGQDEVFGFFGRIMQETSGSFTLEQHDFLANDEHGVVLTRVRAERAGRTLDQNTANVFHINADGKVTEVWGLSEDSAAADQFWS
jgi:ketosteroid isomerase-like protein